MKAKRIFFVLVYIDEAHSSKWPIGLDYHPPPQSNFDERMRNAKDFACSQVVDKGAFLIVVDDWTNPFGETFRAWPDKYYLLDEACTVLAKSEYGRKRDALIDVDCLDMIRDMVQ